jgi:hypothetical protein
VPITFRIGARSIVLNCQSCQLRLDATVLATESVGRANTTAYGDAQYSSCASTEHLIATPGDGHLDVVHGACGDRVRAESDGSAFGRSTADTRVTDIVDLYGYSSSQTEVHREGRQADGAALDHR